MKLTAKQINHFDEIGIDKRAAEATLKVSTVFFSNRMNEIYKEEQSLWNELIEIHNLDKAKGWTYKRVDGSVCIVEKEV